MDFDTILYYFLSTALIFSSVLVISVSNTVYSVLFLILSFITSASILFLLDCEFVALIFIVIYVGAIAVLFLFVVMMLDVKITNSIKEVLKYFPIGSLLCFVFLSELSLILFDSFKPNPYNTQYGLNPHNNWYNRVDYLPDIEVLGQILYTHYIYSIKRSNVQVMCLLASSIAVTRHYVSRFARSI